MYCCNDTSGLTPLTDWQTPAGAPDGAETWNGARLFQAARFVTEMEYQHLVFEEFARKIQPAINPFEPFAFNQTDINPAIPPSSPTRSTASATRCWTRRSRA